MKDGIYTDSDYWSKNELQAMAYSGDLLRLGSGFIGWDFLDNPESRLLFLRENFRVRGVPIRSTALWVQLGGPIPAEIELEEPRRKRYC